MIHNFKVGQKVILSQFTSAGGTFPLPIQLIYNIGKLRLIEQRTSGKDLE